MYRFYLNGTEVTEPQGFEAMILRKSASERYGGFIGGKFGFVQLQGGLTFADSVSVEIIKAESRDIKGRVDVEITFCGRTFFEGTLDLGSLHKGNGSFQAQLISDTNENIILSKHETVYAIQPNRKITLPKKEYYTGGAYEIGTNREYIANTVGGIKLNIAVPLNVIKESGSNNASSSEASSFVVIEGMKDSQMSLPMDAVAPEGLNRQNITVIGLTEGDTVSHSLNTDKLAVRFFDGQGRDVKGMDWEVVDNSTIKLYLPYADTPAMDTFTGDIYIERRFSGE